jgi:hypothetical protein
MIEDFTRDLDFESFCARLLKNPSLVTDLQMPDAHKRRLQKAAVGFDVKKIEPVDCYDPRAPSISGAY